MNHGISKLLISFKHKFWVHQHVNMILQPTWPESVIDLYHSLLGWDSRVLTATGFVQTYWNHWYSFDPPHKYDLPWPIAKTFCHKWLRRRQISREKLVHIRPRRLLGKCVKYNQFFIYTLFGGTHLRVSPIGRFSCLVAQTTWTRATMCLLGFRLYCCPWFKGSNSPPQKNNFGAQIGVFKPNVQKNSNFHIFETADRL